MAIEYCECCGDDTDGLFAIRMHKDHNCEDIDCLVDAPTWCGTCWSRGDCKGPYGGACYKHEEEEWWWRCFECNRLAVPIPKEEPEVNYVICEECCGEEEVV